MITVKCPYENCDWATKNTPYGGYYPTDEILITRYMLHCIDKHGLKNAIWGRE